MSRTPTPHVQALARSRCHFTRCFAGETDLFASAAALQDAIWLSRWAVQGQHRLNGSAIVQLSYSKATRLSPAGHVGSLAIALLQHVYPIQAPRSP
jgi:hypothetical protein